MFTGIVTDIGRVRKVEPTERDRRYEIETAWDTATIDLGASISHAGCCLTVTERGPGWFAVEVSGETSAAGRPATGSTSSARPGSARSWAAISSPAMSTGSAGSSR
jgi:riboflavin synthase alpha subunit